MAPVSLMTAQDPALQAVLEQLAGNTPPPPPSVWPLAIGYWLILLGLILVIAGLVYWQQRRRDWRRIQRQLKSIQQLSTAAEQCTQTHALLRWVRIFKCGDPAGLSETQFRQTILNTLNTDQCIWLNSHYQTSPAAPEWQEVRLLLNSWRKEFKR